MSTATSARYALACVVRPRDPRCLGLMARPRFMTTPVRRASSGPGRRSTESKNVPTSNRSRPLPFKPSNPEAEIGSTGHGNGHGQGQGARPQRLSVADLVRTRWIALFGAGAAALCLGSFTASFVWLNSSPAPVYCTGHEPSVPTGRPAIQSPLEFDLHLDKSEHRYGITKLRRQLGAEAKGHVLEVAIGTGRNLEFYDWGKLTAGLVSPGERNKDLMEKSGWGKTGLKDVKEMDSFTGVDISEHMLDIGLKRIRSVVPHGAEILPAQKPSFADLAKAEDGRWCLRMLGGKCRILKGDAQNDLPPPGDAAAAGKYDTVIQTFGLCSVRDPTRLIENMAAVVRPETGRIILLEHGRSWWDLVNGLLDRSAKGHFERFGCWWNRDIESIVEDAQSKIPGLEIVDMKRPGWFKFGTHFWIELRLHETAGLTRKSLPSPVEEENKSSWWNVGSSALTARPKGESKNEKKSQ